jgi:hypothetical protein
MTTTIVSVLDLVERHTSALWLDLREVLGESREEDGGSPPEAITADSSGSWMEIERRPNETYTWPPDKGGKEEYDPFVLYKRGSQLLALAHNVANVPVKGRDRKQIWVFHLQAGGGSKQPITPFIAADDYDDTREMVAIIRGKGDTKRKMFGPGDELVSDYDDLKVEILRDRVAGHYRMYCVVAHEDDHESMLRHGAAQARLRGF